MHKTGVLLVNLGTPDELTPKAIRRYLREFLNDPRVIDLPFWVRWPLVNLLIVPFRYPQTTANYRKIWGSQGSPLLMHTANLTNRLAQELGSHYQVAFAMRYGKPSISSVLPTFTDCKSLMVIPLFPQYSAAANGSVMEKVLCELQTNWNLPDVKIIHEFYQHPDYIKAYAQTIMNSLREKAVDILLFSYHGLPERHITKSDCRAACDRKTPCPAVSATNHFCYRAQCYATSRWIAAELQIPADKFAVGFQSRLGRTPWIKPYTDELLMQLAAKGYKNIAVVCPSFIADCLETLEEINIRAREQWRHAGGSDFHFIPCVNDSPLIVKALVHLLK